MKRSALLHIMTELADAPLLIHEKKYCAIMDSLGPRIFLGQGEPMVWDDDDDDVLYDSRSEARRKPYAVSRGIATVPIAGTLMNKLYGFQALSGGQTYQGVLNMAREAAADKDVKGIVWDVNSPGGTVSGCFDVADELFKLARTIGKPMIVQSNESMYSGAYALGSALGKIHVNRTAGVGSVGVLLGHVDQSKMDEKMGLKYTYIVAGKHKAEANPHEPLSKEVQERLQADVDKTYTLFTSTVAKFRGMEEKAVIDTQADCFSGADAVASGLADKVATFDETVEELLSLGKTKVGYTGRGAGSRVTTQRGTQMAEEASDDKTVSEDNVVQLNAARKEGGEQAVARATEIAELCALVGFPEMTAGFIKGDKTMSQIRAALQDAKVERSNRSGEMDTHNSTGGQKANKGAGKPWDKMVEGRFGTTEYQKVT